MCNLLGTFQVQSFQCPLLKGDYINKNNSCIKHFIRPLLLCWLSPTSKVWFAHWCEYIYCSFIEVYIDSYDWLSRRESRHYWRNGTYCGMTYLRVSRNTSHRAKRAPHQKHRQRQKRKASEDAAEYCGENKIVLMIGFFAVLMVLGPSMETVTLDLLPWPFPDLDSARQFSFS